MIQLIGWLAKMNFDDDVPFSVRASKAYYWLRKSEKTVTVMCLVIYYFLL